MKVVDRVGVKNPVYLSGNTKAQVTVLACSCANGYVLPPFVIFDRKTLTPELTKGEIPGTLYGLSSNGWIDMELFSGWFCNHFLKFAPKFRPLLLLLDGHASHYCPDVIKMAAKEKVIIFALPPNTTHLTQPLDRACFSPLKTQWKQIVFEKNFFKPEALPQLSGLKYIPLYSPAQVRTKSIRSSLSPTGSTKKISTPIKCGFDILDSTTFNFSTSRQYSYSESNLHNISLDQSSNESKCLIPLQRAGSLSQFLITPTPPSRAITEQLPCGRVLTSSDNIKQLEEKEKNKRAALVEKEERMRQLWFQQSRKLKRGVLLFWFSKYLSIKGANPTNPESRHYILHAHCIYPCLGKQ